MASGNLKSADNPLPCRYHRYPTRSAWAKRLLSIASLCLLISFLASCGLGQASNTGSLKTVAQGSQGQFTYVAIGASDTFGIGTEDPYSENWPTDLAGMLGSHVHLINLGIPGIVVHEALSIELPIALDSHPELVTIWLAVNDLVANVPIDSYSHDLDLMLSRLQASAPHARILVANVPDLTLLPYFKKYDPLVLQGLVQAYNAAIAGIVQQHHVILVNLTQQSYNIKAHPEYISRRDGLHPNDLGYMQIAKVFYTTLQHAQEPAKKT